jgi:hypothetical protein
MKDSGTGGIRQWKRAYLAEGLGSIPSTAKKGVEGGLYEVGDLIYTVIPIIHIISFWVDFSEMWPIGYRGQGFLLGSVLVCSACYK